MERQRSRARSGPTRDVGGAIRRAREAQASWAARPVSDRARYVLAMRAAIVERADAIAEAIARCTGKTRVDALSTEVLPAAIAASHYVRIAPRILAPRRLRRSSILFITKRSVVSRVPLGVVGIISPWNYPFGIPAHDVFTGFLAGNAILLKVATQARPVGEAIAEVVKASGLPDGLFSLVNLSGPAALEAMLCAGPGSDGMRSTAGPGSSAAGSTPGIDKLFFTGSTETGKLITARAAACLVPVVLELGGNDAMIVLDDANLDRAAAGALWAGVSGTGQSCGGVERVFVEEGAWDGLRTRLVDMVGRLRVGVTGDFGADVGSMTLREQKTKVETMVADALSKGAKILVQRGPSTGLFHPVTVLEGADASMRVMREEVFGPVIALAKVRDEEEAIARANDCAYGLTASVWTRSPRRGRRVADRLRVGSVTLNDHLMSHGMAETPWGGFGASGSGRSHGEQGFEEMTAPRVVVSESLHRAPRDMWWYPHDRSLYDGLKGALVGLYGRGATRRLAGLAGLVRTFSRTFTRTWAVRKDPS